MLNFEKLCRCSVVFTKANGVNGIYRFAITKENLLEDF